MPIFDKPAVSTARFRGKTLIGWFGDAVSPVLWRWQEEDVSSGFGLRDNGGSVDLVQHMSGGAPVTVATFGARPKAEHALSAISEAMMSRASLSGKIVRGVLIALGLLFMVVALRDAAISLFQPAPAQLAAAPARMPVQAQAQAQPARSAVPGLPVTAAPPSPPSQGTAVDVDSFYR